MLMLSLSVSAEPVDSLLAIFDRKPSMKNADAFFAYLYAEEFTDAPRMYRADPVPPMDTVKALVWYWAGEWYYATQQYPLAEKNLLRAVELMQYADRVSYSDNLAMLGLVEMRQSKYEEALKYMHKCYELDMEGGDADRISSSLNTIAGTLLAAGNPEEAEGYILRAISYAKQVDNPSRMAVIYGMASEIEHGVHKDEQALLYADSACAMEKTTGNTYKMMVRLSQKASILDGLRRYAEAEAILKEVVPFFREIGDQMSLVISLNKAGLAAYGQEKYDEALQYLYESIEVCQRIGDIYNEAYAQREVYEILFKKNPDEAREHLERYHALKDSLYSHATAEQVARFNAEFGRDELEKEKAMLAERNHRLVWYGIAGLIVVLIGAVVSQIVRRSRQKKINEQLSNMMEELNEVRQSSAKNNGASPAEDEANDLTTKDKEFLKKLILSVTEMMGKQTVTVTQIADKMCMSAKTLNRRVQDITGEGTKRYIMRIQLEQARIMLLRDLEVSIMEIGVRCGFEDHSSFTRTFTSYYGMSPTAYRTTRGKG